MSRKDAKDGNATELQRQKRRNKPQESRPRFVVLAETSKRGKSEDKRCETGRAALTRVGETTPAKRGLLLYPIELPFP